MAGLLFYLSGICWKRITGKSGERKEIMRKYESSIESIYAEEDRKAIALLAEEIVENAQYMKNIYKIKPKRVSVEDKKNHMYAFYGEKELSLSLYLFFASRYNAKVIARKCYQGDEDDIIRETMDCYDFSVGRIKCKDGSSKESRLVEAKMKILNFWPPGGKRDPDTHMPFELMGFRIVSDDDIGETDLTIAEAHSLAERKVYLELNSAAIEYECHRRGIRSRSRVVREQKLVEAMEREYLEHGFQ